MDIEVVKKLIQKYQEGHSRFVHAYEEADRYYRNETDVLIRKTAAEEEETANPIRNADNRIPFNFHGLLVNQKASYIFTAPPAFDIGSAKANKELQQFLGDKYPKICKDLCIEASNATVGWLHVWHDDEKGYFKYAVVPSAQVIPIWNKSLEKELLGVMRVYQDIDDTGELYNVYEYWNDTICQTYRMSAGGDLVNDLQPYRIFYSNTGELVNEFAHGIGEVPFFAFYNNNIGTNDLKNIKELIDTYCNVFSGFANDLEDIQQIIFVLTNYGGQDLGEFLTDLKKYKTIKIDSDGTGDSSGVSTLTIDLPVEAREKLMEVTRKCIFEQGMGIDPDPQNFGNSSGVALSFLYSLLELKSGLMETEFRPSFGRFIRCVCRVSGIGIKDDTIIQTWTRTSVRNDQETAQIAVQSKDVISQKTLLQNHPWVEDVSQELDQIQKETDEEMRRMDDYGFMGGDHQHKDVDEEE